MKKYLLHSIFVFVAILLVFVTSCKKNDDNNTDQNPANAFRIIKQELNYYDDTSNYIVQTSFGNNKLSTYHFYGNGELLSKSNYIYDGGEDWIFRVDTSYSPPYDLIQTDEVQFTVKNNLIAKAVSSNEWLRLAEYTYEGENITKWEYFRANGSPFVKGEYTYQGDKLTSYSYYSMDNDGTWELSSKSEFTYLNGKRHEMLFYIRFVTMTEGDLVMKYQYVYNGELLVNMNTLLRTLEDEWYLTYTSYFEYDGNGNLSMVKEYATDGTNEVLYSDITYTWEQGESNMEMFYKIENQLLMLDPGYPVWGFQSASTREDFMKKRERFIIR